MVVGLGAGRVVVGRVEVGRGAGWVVVARNTVVVVVDRRIVVGDAVPVVEDPVSGESVEASSPSAAVTGVASSTDNR